MSWPSILRLRPLSTPARTAASLTTRARPLARRSSRQTASGLLARSPPESDRKDSPDATPLLRHAVNGLQGLRVGLRAAEVLVQPVHDRVVPEPGVAGL